MTSKKLFRRSAASSIVICDCVSAGLPLSWYSDKGKARDHALKSGWSERTASGGILEEQPSFLSTASHPIMVVDQDATTAYF